MSLEWFSTSKEDEKNVTREYTKGKLTESDSRNKEDIWEKKKELEDKQKLKIQKVIKSCVFSQ